MTVDAPMVEEAAHRLSPVVSRTPLERNERLGRLTGGEVWLKREDLQTVRSYKVRGAYNFISQLDERARLRGVVAASAGNHAQGLAYACSALGVPGRVYLPRTTPRQKRDRIAQLGGSMVEIVIGSAETYDDASKAATLDALATGATLVPAFDDPRTIAGQGTVVAEVFGQLAELGRVPDVVVVPVGGGGLLAGTVAWLGRRHPEVRIIGVEPAGAACLAAALAAGGPVTLGELDTFVDGAAVRRAGDVTYPLIAGSKAELVAVAEGQVCSEMLALYQSDGIIAEPAGALSSAWLTSSVAGPIGGPTGGPIPAGAIVVCILSGGNNDVSRYAEVVERALIHEGRKHYFLVEFPQEPGALRRFLDEVLGPDDDITLFEYTKRNNRETGPALVGVELSRAEDLQPLLARMQSAPSTIQRIDPDSAQFRFML